MTVEPLPADWEWSARIMVWGSAPYPRSLAFIAKVGDQLVDGIAVSQANEGFVGYLKDSPQPGDRLTVQFAGREPVDTGLVVSADPPNA